MASDAAAAAVNLEEIDFDELDDYLELFQQDGVIKEALSQGVDLRQYAQQMDRELRAAEAASVAQYVAKAEDIVELHDQVQACDNLLARMQEMLLGFQADLGGISDEIRHLQDESIGMNVRLKNRRATEQQLQVFLDQVALAPSLIKTIDDAEVNDVYLHALVSLSGKLDYAARAQAPTPTPETDDSSNSSTDQGLSPSQIAACKDVAAPLEKLRARAAARVREFLLAKVNDMKKPKTNVQMVQQNTLLPMKYLVSFLCSHAPQVESEFRDVYAEAMSKTLVNVFRAYHVGLLKLHEEMAARSDLLAVEEQSLKGRFTSRVNLSKRSDTFAVAEREQILRTAAAPPILLHVAQQENQKLPYEAIFRSVQQHLMDSATSEYLFLLEFFKSADTRDLFLRVFAKTLSLCLENLENYLFTCYDALGLLLMIRVTHAQRDVMARRRIPVLDAYFDRVLLLLWPRFRAVFDLHLVSVRSAKIKKLGAIDLHPHYVVRRYAEFTSSVLSLMLYTQQGASSGGDSRYGADTNGNDDDPLATISSAAMHERGAGEMVLASLTTLRDEMLALLARLADQHRNAKDKCVFLVNNLDLIVTMLQERRVVAAEVSAFETLLSEQREKFVEEELVSFYAPLIRFVRQHESAILHANNASGPGSGSTAMTAGGKAVDAAQVEKIVRDFAATWKQGIERMNGDVLRFFANFRNGMEILKLVLTQLLLYYTRFVEVVKRSFDRAPPSFQSDIVTTQEILYEIKKYSRSF